MTDDKQVAAMRKVFEAWHSSQGQAEPELERIYELSEEGMNELVKETMFEAWQAATLAERERCAKVCEVLNFELGHNCADAIRAGETLEGGT